MAALVDAGIKAVVVSHLCTFADGFYRQGARTAMFLRAEREGDWRRRFRLAGDEPLSSSLGSTCTREWGGLMGLGR
ncbi:MAG: hypothetical protein M1115_02570 [Actinobacteria bacterium]|nr:hypothetical protein [Actinomycetota bacterium]